MTPQLAKPFIIQGLCEDICQLLFSVDVNDINIFLHDMISEKVMTNFNVLCLRVLDWIVGNLDGAFVVAEERYLFQIDAIVLESFSSTEAEHNKIQQQCIQIQQLRVIHNFASLKTNRQVIVPESDMCLM